MDAKAGINILLVEDDEMQLKLLEAALQRAGFSYVSARDGHGALENLNRETFNLVISDVNMPGGISGFNLVKTVRGIERLKEIPFIFVTGRGDKSDVAKAIGIGVDDYIIKPIDQDMLLAKIEALISKKGTLYSFSERPVRAAARLDANLTIDGISEQAIQFLSPIPIPDNYKITIDAEIYSEIGIDPPRLRVTRCEDVHGQQNYFRIRANFIGLSAKEMDAVRRWLLSNPTKSTRQT